MARLHPALLLALGLLSCAGTSAFQAPVSSGGSSFVGSRHQGLVPTAAGTPIRREGSSRLRCSILPAPVAGALSRLSPPVRNSLLIGSAAVFLYRNRPKNFPAPRDASFSEPLPDGSLGCPYLGNLSFFTKIGDAETGAGKFFRYQARRSGSPGMFKYAMLGKPVVIINGMKNVKKIFNQEFRLVKTASVDKSFTRLMGGESLLFTSDPDRHQYLRRLVGQSMTPEQINYAMGNLLTSARNQLETLQVGQEVEMEQVMTSFTLDVAWRQILGLDLKENEVDTFRDAVNDWIGGLNPINSLLPGKRFRKPAKAFTYIVSKIEQKIESLKANGPDGSTMSGMVFARDEEDPTKSLTKDEIISNSLLLILAGSETAASTLTTAMLALGLHKDVLQKLKDEQLAMIEKHGGKELTRDMLEKDCPYLDAVIKEVMRIKPLPTSGAMRFAEETFVVDGKQVPKGYGVGFNPYLTHALDPALKVDDADSHMDVVKGFKPERWLADETKPTEYMPFGIGPRYCLGANLAMAEMKVFLALFAQRVEFDLTNTTADTVEWKKISILPKPKDGAVITVLGIDKPSKVVDRVQASPIPL